LKIFSGGLPGDRKLRQKLLGNSGENGDGQATVNRFLRKSLHVDQLFQGEVFDRWPDQVKDFLVRIAFLDKFCGSLCRAVTGLADSGEYLRKLAQSNSFIFHLDRENEWFRFHHLFGEFLQQRLEKEKPSFRRELYRKAGRWYRENGLAREAIEAFIKSGVYEQAVPLLREIYLSMTQDGEYADWLEWMGKIPPEYYEEHVRTCAGCSWVLSMENRIHEAKFWADKAQASFDRTKDGLAADEKDFLERLVLITKANLAIREMNMDRVGYYFKQANRFELSQHIHIGEMNSGEVSLLKTAYGFRGRLKKFDQLCTLLSPELPRLIGNFSAYLTVGLA